MYAEALNTYQVIVKNKMFSNAGNQNDLTIQILKVYKSYYITADSTVSVFWASSVQCYYINLFNSCILSGRLRVNMGNIYFEQKKYPQAVKQYRMALDQVPNTHKDMRCAFLNYAALFEWLLQMMFS